MSIQVNRNNIKERKLYLDVLRVFAIISISLNHAVNRTYDNFVDQQAEFMASSMVSTLIKTVVSVFSRIGVPLFLMITGVLILNKTFETSKDIKNFYKNNVLHLFITTEIWYCIMYWFIVLCNPGVTVLQDEGSVNAIFEMLKTMLFLNQRSLGSMWYMPMILCIYLVLPFWAVIVKKFDIRYVFIPLLVSFFSFMLLPSLNFFRLFQGWDWLTTVLNTGDLPSIYLIYILVGYWLGTGGLSKLKDWVILVVALTSFGSCCAYQYYAYSMPENYLVSYSSPGILLTAAFVFAYLKRKEKYFIRFKDAFAYLSKISFAIYFVHIVIMEFVNWNFTFSNMHSCFKMLLLEVISILGSILIISIFSKNKICKKYLFMIKD